MDAFIELDLLEHHIKQVVPAANFALLNLPLKQTEQLFWIDLVDETDTTPGRGISIIQRDWKMSYYHSKKTEVLRALGRLRELFGNDTKLAYTVDGKTHYITIGAFSSGAMHVSGDDVHFSFSILRTTSHGSRSYEESEKMKDIIIILNPTPPNNPSTPGDSNNPDDPDNPSYTIPITVPCVTLNTIRGGLIFQYSTPLYTAAYDSIGPHLITGEADL